MLKVILFMCFSFPDWASKLANTYWFLRYNRKFNQAARRKYYRRIANEKKRLTESGVDAELVRLLCRHLAKPSCPHAKGRYMSYQQQACLFEPH